MPDAALHPAIAPVSRHAAADGAMVFTHGRSSLVHRQGVRHLRLDEADPYQTGVACGRLLRASGDAMVRLLRKPLVAGPIRLGAWVLRRHFRTVEVPAAIEDEVRGLAAGTGIAFATLFAANFVFDVMKRLGFHCSTLAFFQGDTVLVGRNTDLLPALAALALRCCRPMVVEVSMPGRVAFSHVSMPLFVGVLNGFNAHGIGVHSHQILNVAEQPQGARLASALLMRLLLEQADSLEAAAAIARRHPTMRSLNVMVISQREQRGIVLEVHPDQVHVCEPAGHFGCTTHFESAVMRPRHDGEIGPSQDRLATMAALIDAHPRPDAAALQQMLQDRRNGLRHRLSGCSLANAGTFQSFVFDLARRRVWVSNGRHRPVASHGEFVELTVGGAAPAAAGVVTAPERPVATEALPACLA